MALQPLWAIVIIFNQTLIGRPAAGYAASAGRQKGSKGPLPSATTRVKIFLVGPRQTSFLA